MRLPNQYLSNFRLTALIFPQTDRTVMDIWTHNVNHFQVEDWYLKLLHYTLYFFIKWNHKIYFRDFEKWNNIDLNISIHCFHNSILLILNFKKYIIELSLIFLFWVCWLSSFMSLEIINQTGSLLLKWCIYFQVL